MNISAGLDCFERIDRPPHVQQRTPLSCDWIETLESLLGRRQPHVIQDGRTVFKPDKRGHLDPPSLPGPATHSVVRVGVWACSPEHAKRTGRCRSAAQGAVFQSRHIIHPICLLWKLLHLGREIARGITRLLWIRLICDLELNFRVTADDLIAPRAFCAIQRSVCGRKCIFLCIQPGGQDGRTRAHGDSNS